MPQTRRRAILDVEEIGGDEFASLAEAQQMALPSLAADFTSSIRAMLSNDTLAIYEGRVVVPETKQL